MTAIKVKSSQFTGLSKVYSREPDGLAAIVRGLAIDHAKIAVAGASVPSFTDNSGGSAAYPIALPVVPTTPIAVDSAGGVNYADLNTSLGKTQNALAVLSKTINIARNVLGLPLITNAYGTVASANTIPAQDLSGTAATGASAADFETSVAALTIAQQSFFQLVEAANDVFVAVGGSPLQLPPIQRNLSTLIVAIPSIVAYAANSGEGLNISDANAFLAALASGIAELAYQWNDATTVSTISALTDSTTGTASLTTVAALDLAPVAYEDVSTSSAPLAGFNTQLGKATNALSSILAKLNLVRERVGLPVIADNSGGTISSTLAALSATFSAVNGTGNDSVSQASLAVSLGLLADNIATLTAAANDLASDFSTTTLTDNSGGIEQKSVGLAAVTAATGVNNSAAATGVANSELEAAWAVVMDNISTLAAKANLYIGSSAPAFGLSVIAG